MFENKKILVLSPHTDDGELGCGGTINRINQGDSTIYHVAFSIANDSLLDGFKVDTLSAEFLKANAELGLNSWHYDFPVRYFPDHRQAILEILIDLKEKIKPDVVFCPSSNDIHQDHNVIYQEAVRAFKRSTLLGYELIWNNFVRRSNLFVKLDRIDVQTKKNAIDKYESQKTRQYMLEGSWGVFGLAEYNGHFINTTYAECFEVIRAVI